MAERRSTRRGRAPKSPTAGRPALDWNDSEARGRWLADLRGAVDDALAVTGDMLRPVRKRRLGHAEANRLHVEARGKLRAILAYAGAE